MGHQLRQKVSPRHACSSLGQLGAGCTPPTDTDGQCFSKYRKCSHLSVPNGQTAWVQIHTLLTSPVAAVGSIDYFQPQSLTSKMGIIIALTSQSGYEA